MTHEPLEVQPRRKKWPWLVLVLVVAAIAAVIAWRWAPPVDATMAQLRSADVLYESVYAPVPPDGAAPGRPLTAAQSDALEAKLAAVLHGTCTPAYLAELKHTARGMTNRVSSALARGEDYAPSHPYEYMRDLQFRYRTWGGALVFDVYEPGQVAGGTPESGFVTQRIRFEKVDGAWRIAELQHFGA